MPTSRFLNPSAPGGLLSTITGLLTSDETLIIQAIENGTYFVINEVPTGVLNSNNVTFTLANAPNPATSLEVYLNGIKQVLTQDYTLSSSTITFVVAPDPGVMRVNYIHSPV